jgi:hypothetical protein
VEGWANHSPPPLYTPFLLNNSLILSKNISRVRQFPSHKITFNSKYCKSREKLNTAVVSNKLIYSKKLFGVF